MISIYDVLKASKGIHVDDTFAELWGRKLSNAYTVDTYSGTLPTTLTGTKAGYLGSYKIYGNLEQTGTPTPENPIVPSGCGERTGNFFNGHFEQGTTASGAPTDANNRVRSNIITTVAGAFCVDFKNGELFDVAFDFWNDELSVLILVEATSWLNTKNYITPNNATRVRIKIRKSNDALITPAEVIDFGMYHGSTAPTSYIPYGYKLPLTVNSVEYPIYLGNAPLVKDEYVDSTTGKIYRRTENLSPPEEEWIDEWIWGDGTIHPSTEIKTSPFIDVSTCETCIMEVFSAETEWAAAGYRKMAFYDENKQYLGWIGGGGRQTLRPNSSERLSEFPAGTVYVRISCSHGDQPFYPQLVSGYTPVHQFYSYHVPTDPPAPFPQIPTAAGATVIDYNGTPKPDKVELTYKKPKGQ